MSSEGYYNDGRSEQGSWGGYNQQQYPQQHQYGQQHPGYPPRDPSPYGEPPQYNEAQSEYPHRSHSPYAQQNQYHGPPAEYPPREHSPYAPPSQYDVQQQCYPPRNSSPYESGYNRPPPGEYGEGWPGNEPRHSQQPGYGDQQGHQQDYPTPGQPGYPAPGQEGYPVPGQEGERGFLGAVAGGAAGAFGGHKLGHGVLGGLGGAVAGSMLQDHFKHKKEEEHKQKQQQQIMHQQQQQQGFIGGASPRPNHGNFRGNFSASSTQISLDRDYDLIASCGDTSGHNRLTSVSLNDCLTNEWGNFKWGRGGNFGASARDVKLVDGGRVLEAELADGSGGWKRSHIILDERITNDNGELKFLD